MLTDQFSRRFRELQKESDLIPFDSGNLSTYVPAGSWEGWATSAKQSLAEVYKTWQQCWYLRHWKIL